MDDTGRINMSSDKKVEIGISIRWDASDKYFRGSITINNIKFDFTMKCRGANAAPIPNPTMTQLREMFQLSLIKHDSMIELDDKEFLLFLALLGEFITPMNRNISERLSGRCEGTIDVLISNINVNTLNNPKFGCNIR